MKKLGDLAEAAGLVISELVELGEVDGYVVIVVRNCVGGADAGSDQSLASNIKLKELPRLLRFLADEYERAEAEKP